MSLLFLLLSFDLFTGNTTIPNISTIPCEIAYEREIINTNSKRVDLVPEYFFSFSHPELKSIFKENNFIRTYCQISKNNGFIHLNLNFNLASSVAKNEYGVVSKRSNLIIHLIKGGQLTLKCGNGSLGKSNDATNKTVYALTYELDQKHVKKLKKYDIDKVELEWSSGFESYEVYEIDAIYNQLNCMEKLGYL
ncbi:MAG: hypothetical protein V3V00_11325 [Saprospiraceae bacterium]